jgi:predicted PurR-regulated permease PerM
METPPAFPSRHDDEEGRFTDRVIRLAFLGLFAWWSLELVLPFLGFAIWSVILTVALYPVYWRLARLLGGRRRLSAALLTIFILCLVAGPVALLATNLVETVGSLVAALKDGSLKVPPPPPGVAAWPLVGEQLSRLWELASTNLATALASVVPEPRVTAAMILGRLSAIGGDIILFLVAVLISGFLYNPGPRIVAAARLFASRLVAPRGEAFVDMAGATIRSVSQGVIGLAFLEALAGGIVLLSLNVPGAGLIAFAILILSLVQVGPLLVLIPLVIWAWMTQSAALAALVTVAAVVILLMDNLLKPLLIRRGLKTPMLVILAGVIGGTISHGMIGLFLGPVVLAVFYELLVAWTLSTAAVDAVARDADRASPLA